jgi:large subunit ribosomal protein L18e
MKSQSTNPQLAAIVTMLRKRSRETKTPLYRRLAQDLCKSKRSRRTVNISKIARHTSEGSVVAIPGKVLSAGMLSHKVTVAAFKFSNQAKTKIEKTGGRCISLDTLAKENPKGKKIILLG